MQFSECCIGIDETNVKEILDQAAHSYPGVGSNANEGKAGLTAISARHIWWPYSSSYSDTGDEILPDIIRLSTIVKRFVHHFKIFHDAIYGFVIACNADAVLP